MDKTADVGKETWIQMNLNIPESIKTWLETESSKNGTTQESLIVTALMSYIDQQKNIDLLPESFDDSKGTNEVENEVEVEEKNISAMDKIRVACRKH